MGGKKESRDVGRTEENDKGYHRTRFPMGVGYDLNIRLSILLISIA